MRISDWSSDVCSSDLQDNGWQRQARGKSDEIPDLGPADLPQCPGERFLRTADCRLLNGCTGMRQFNAARIQRFTRRSAYGLRSYAADHAGHDEHVKNGADTQRTDKATRHIPRSEEHTSELQSLMRLS